LVCDELSRAEVPANGVPLRQLNDSLVHARDLIKELSCGGVQMSIKGTLEPLFFKYRPDQFEIFKSPNTSGWSIRLVGYDTTASASAPETAAPSAAPSAAASVLAPAPTFEVAVQSLSGELVFGPEICCASMSAGDIRMNIEKSMAWRKLTVELTHRTNLLRDLTRLEDLACESTICLTAIFMPMVTRRPEKSLFVFGPMMADEVLKAFVTRMPCTSPATLHGFSRYLIKK